MRWRGGAEVRSLAGQPVRVRFVLKDADVFSYRFRAGPDEAKDAPAGTKTADAGPETVTVCADGGAGAYEAFPDVCRLADGRLQCVFYASYTHVGVPSAAWPRGGRVSVVRSGDEGRTWKEGHGSNIRARRFRVTDDGVEWLRF